MTLYICFFLVYSFLLWDSWELFLTQLFWCYCLIQITWMRVGVCMQSYLLCRVLFSSHCLWPSNDCAVCFQSNLLQDFSKLSPGRSRKSRSRQVLDALWLELAVGLSFSTDGQQMLLRIDGQCCDGQIWLWDESWSNEPCEDGCGIEWQALWEWLWCSDNPCEDGCGAVTSPLRMVVV